LAEPWRQGSVFLWKRGRNAAPVRPVNAHL
jgi:hypothetical protein